MARPPKKAAPAKARAAVDLDADDAPSKPRKALSLEQVTALEDGLDMKSADGLYDHGLRLMRRLLRGEVASDIAKAYKGIVDTLKSLEQAAATARREKLAARGVEIVKGAAKGVIPNDTAPPPDSLNGTAKH